MIAIVVPAYKPSAALVHLLTELRPVFDGPIVVVDDGGGPQFQPIFNQLKTIEGARVLVNAVNLGKGAALKHAINFCMVEYPELTGVVCADADGQHAISDILKVAARLDTNPDSFVLGARVFGSNTPLRSKLGNEISRVVYRVLLGLRLKDTQTGLRGLPMRLCAESLAIRSNRYEFETEQLMVSHRLGIKIDEVEIQTIYEDNNSSSHFNPVFDSAKIYFAVMRYGASSILTATVDLVAFIILSAFIPNIIVNNLASRGIALVVQFFLLKRFVFHTSAGLGRFVLFVLYVAATGVVSGVLQSAMVDGLGVPLVPAKLVADLGIFLFNFLFLRDILFAKSRPLETAPEASAR